MLKLSFENKEINLNHISDIIKLSFSFVWCTIEDQNVSTDKEGI